MSDLEQLRRLADRVSPPPYEAIAAAARRRDRRSAVATAVVAASAVVLVTGGVVVVRGLDLAGTEPARPPTTSNTPPVPTPSKAATSGTSRTCAWWPKRRFEAPGRGRGRARLGSS